MGSDSLAASHPLARFFGGLVGPFWCLAGDFYKPDDRHLRLTVLAAPILPGQYTAQKAKPMTSFAAEVYPVNI